MPFSEVLSWIDEDHTDGLHPKGGCSMYQKYGPLWSQF